jgi:hypothetical protein
VFTANGDPLDRLLLAGRTPDRGAGNVSDVLRVVDVQTTYGKLSPKSRRDLPKAVWQQGVIHEGVLFKIVCGADRAIGRGSCPGAQDDGYTAAI